MEKAEVFAGPRNDAHVTQMRGLVEIEGREYYICVGVTSRTLTVERNNGQYGCDACIDGNGQVLVLGGRTPFWSTSEWEQIANFAGCPEVVSVLVGKINLA